MKSWDRYRVIDRTTGAVFEGDKFDTEDYLCGLIEYYNRAGENLWDELSSEYILSEGNCMMLEDVLNIIIEAF